MILYFWVRLILKPEENKSGAIEFLLKTIPSDNIYDKVWEAIKEIRERGNHTGRLVESIRVTFDTTETYL